MENSQKLQLTNESTITKIEGFGSIEEMKKYADTLIKSNLVPKSLNTPEKVITVVLQGKELGFDPITSLSNIHNIQGKPTLSVHAIAALLKKAGITYKLMKDAERVGEGEDLDVVTTIRFYERFGNEIITNDISYSYKEAKKAGLLLKDNWQRMLKIMLRTRCLAIGARFVAPHALLGLYETAEWADVKNMSYTVDEEGEVILNQ